MKHISLGLISVIALLIIACEGGTTVGVSPNVGAASPSATAESVDSGTEQELDESVPATPTPAPIPTQTILATPTATIVVLPTSTTTVVPKVSVSNPSSPIVVPTETPSPTATATAVDQSSSVTKIVYLSEEWADVWLCADAPVESADLTAGGTQTCSVSTEVIGDNLVITSSGIPNHDFESTLGCCASEQNSVWIIPLEPELSESAPMSAPERGPVAFTVTGVAIYGPEEGPGGDAVALEYGYFVEDRQAVDLGVCGGHAGPGGEYHYHYDSNCMHWHQDSQDISGYDIVDLAESVISKVVGFAFDGFPIYSSYEPDIDGSVVEVTSSYKLKEGADGYGGIDDYLFVDDLGDLDECNGHFGPTPDVPSGTYHYHSTLTNGEGDLGFPYFPLCYKGVVSEDNIQSTNLPDGGGQGGPPAFGQPPPPRR